MRMALAILLLASPAFAQDEAKCVTWTRTERTTFEWDGKSYKGKGVKESKRVATYELKGQRVEIESANSDAAELAAVRAKNNGKPVTLKKEKLTAKELAR